MGLVVRYDFVARLVSTSHVKTSALVRDQLQVWLHYYGVEVLDTTVLLRTKAMAPRALVRLNSSIQSLRGNGSKYRAGYRATFALFFPFIYALTRSFRVHFYLKDKRIGNTLDAR